MSAMKPLLMFALVFLFHRSKQDETNLPGHMQPLGSHRPMEGEIERIDYIPDPVTFYEKFVQESRPVVMEGAVKDTTPLKMWTDEYLKSNFGDREVHVEMKKKEDRKGPVQEMSMREFINRYKKEPVYVVGDVPEGMKEQVELPGCISCGGYLDNVHAVFMWFSSGGTKSVLHTDSFHNMHCVVSGEKRFIMLPTEYTKVIGPEWEGQGYYNLDVEAVNMTAYPKMVDVPWYKAVLSPGDCMYIPYHWIHHVHSINRNIGVNLWWAPYQPSMKECKGRTDFKDLISLVDVVPKPFLAMKLIFLTAVSEDKKIYAEEVLSKLHKHPMMGEFFTREAVGEIFDIIRPNSGGVLEESEILNMPHDKAQTLMGTFERIEMEMMEKMYGDFEGGGFPPEDGEWSDEGPPPPHQHFEL